MHNERRDRSILFWKSLPVPDLTTVLAKAIVPLAILPAVTLVVTFGTQLIMLAMGLADLTAHGKSTDPALSVPLAEMSVVLVYALATLTLWWAPVYGWLLLVSVWARRAPFLWAVLPPIAVAIAEKVAFGTNRIGDVIMLRLIGGAGYAFESPPRGGMRPGTIPTIGVDQIDAGKFFSSPDLWIGLIVAVALLAATVWLRRDREPI
jgi:ABC-2 type transport system permease protein